MSRGGYILYLDSKEWATKSIERTGDDERENGGDERTRAAPRGVKKETMGALGFRWQGRRVLRKEGSPAERTERIGDQT